jgi:hypothetical protein
VSSITILSDDATIWSITYDCHYDDHNSFIIQATGQISKTMKNLIHLKTGNEVLVLMKMVADAEIFKKWGKTFYIIFSFCLLVDKTYISSLMGEHSLSYNTT